MGFVFSVVNGVGSLQIKSPENLLVSGLGFLSGPSQAVAGSQVSHVAAAVAWAAADGLKMVFILARLYRAEWNLGREDFKKL